MDVFPLARVTCDPKRPRMLTRPHLLDSRPTYASCLCACFRWSHYLKSSSPPSPSATSTVHQSPRFHGPSLGEPWPLRQSRLWPPGTPTAATWSSSNTLSKSKLRFHLRGPQALRGHCCARATQSNKDTRFKMENPALPSTGSGANSLF